MSCFIAISPCNEWELMWWVSDVSRVGEGGHWSRDKMFHDRWHRRVTLPLLTIVTLFSWIKELNLSRVRIRILWLLSSYKLQCSQKRKFSCTLSEQALHFIPSTQFQRNLIKVRRSLITGKLVSLLSEVLFWFLISVFLCSVFIWRNATWMESRMANWQTHLSILFCKTAGQSLRVMISYFSHMPFIRWSGHVVI